MGLDCLSDYEARPPTMTAMHRAAKRRVGADPWSQFCSYMDAEGWLRLEARKRRDPEWQARRQRESDARLHAWDAEVAATMPDPTESEAAAEIDRINAEAGECR